MPLLSPLVGGPLSPCSTAIRILGALPGATLEIWAVSPATGASLMTTGIASGAETIIEVPEGSLLPEDVIKAVQEHAGERSPEADVCPDGVEVSWRPEEGDLMAPVWPLRLHEGGRCTALAGLFPGTLVTITDATGTAVAEGRALDTTLRVSLSRPIRASDRLTAKTQACELNGPESSSPIPVISYMNSELPQPVVREPLVHCGTHIYVGEVFEGAMVSLLRRHPELGEREFVGCFDHPELYFGFPVEDHLVEGEEIQARQGYVDTDRWSALSDPVVVQPPEALPRPRLIGSICAGSFRLVVKDLEREATVTIFHNGVPLGSATAYSSTSVFSLLPLEEGMITVVQRLCDRDSDPSEGVPVEGSHPDRPPVVSEPYECATLVHVKDVWPGARIRIRSRRLGFIGEATAAGEEVLVRVPALSANDRYWVTEDVCGMEPRDDYDNEFIVRSIGIDGVAAPTLQGSILTSDRTVKVANILPGAIVEVYVDDGLRGAEFRGSIESGTEEIDIPINGMISEGNTVRVLQRICDHPEAWSSEPVEIRRCRGRIRAGLRGIARVADDDMSVERQAQAFQRDADRMRTLFRFYGFDVEFVGMKIDRNGRFEEVDAYSDAEIAELMTLRDIPGLGEQDIVIYQVPSARRLGGFHRHGDRGVVTAQATDVREFFNVAHEVAHFLGLGDLPEAPDYSARLMYPTSEGRLTTFADALDDLEVGTMEATCNARGYTC